jgi:Putative lumazine-binding
VTLKLRATVPVGKLPFCGCSLDSSRRVRWTELVNCLIQLSKGAAAPEGLTMATDQELVAQTGQNLTEELMLQACEGEGAKIADRWMKIEIADIRGGIASAAVRSARYREYLRLINIGDWWKISDALWLPR